MDQKEKKAAYLREYSKSEKAIERRKKYVEKIKQEGKVSEYNRKYRLNKGKEKLKEYYQNNKELWKDYDLKKRYGISLDEYNEMLVKQNYTCAICQGHESSYKRGLFVDHCHTTGAVRSLLCNQCNTGIGNFSENVNIMKKAIEYIERYQK